MVPQATIVTVSYVNRMTNALVGQRYGRKMNAAHDAKVQQSIARKSIAVGQQEYVQLEKALFRSVVVALHVLR